MGITWIIKKIKNNSNDGFTLIELIASVLIFSVLMVVFGSVFVFSLNAQKRAFNVQQVVDNANFIFDSMAKEIRVAEILSPNTNSNCLDSSTSQPVTRLDFNHPVNGQITYTLVGTDLHRIIGGTTDTVLNSSSVEFTRLEFCIIGNTLGDGLQPRITIKASARSKNSQQQETINLQTTLSQRFLSN